MKFIFTTDWHLISRVPSKRNPDILEKQFEKVSYILKEAKENQVEFIIHGGDFFDEYSPDLWLILRSAKLLSENNIPFYVVPGNHDLFGDSLDSLDRCGLTVLSLLGVITLFIKQLEIHSIKFQPVFHKTFSLSSLNVSADVFVIHEPVVPESVPFPHFLCKDIDLFWNKLFLCGDFHLPFEWKGKSVFLNPGCVVRKSISERVFNPGFYLIEYKDGRWLYERREIPVKGEFVFDAPKEETIKLLNMNLTYDKPFVNIIDLIKEVAFDLKISKEALNRLLAEIIRYV